MADIETNYDSDLPPVPSYPGEFNQVILNLIINATHAIGEVTGNGDVKKEKIEIPEDFKPKPDCVCCNGTGVKTYLINLFDGEIYREKVCLCHCLRRVRVI